MGSVEKLIESILDAFFSVFAFLPTWVHVFVGGAFVFIIAVILYRLVRG